MTSTRLVRGKWRVCVCLLFSCAAASAAELEPTRHAVVAAMQPYDGVSAFTERASSLDGKVMCGYQGWFAAQGDGSGRGWRHYTERPRFAPGSCSIDLWPDVSDFKSDEKFPTAFHHADGRVAEVFSSTKRHTALHHFRWMEENGIDGVFVQRFGVETIHAKDLRQCNLVLAHCREAANLHRRCYALMYDLSLLPQGGVQTVIDDWKLLVDKMQIGKNPQDLAYLHHQGKPVVAVWGIGFNDGRKYTLAECDRLIDLLKNDPHYGGFTVMVGVPTGWRTLDDDSIADPALHRVLAKADIISPWTVGRYRTLSGVADHADKRWRLDVKWCQEKQQTYLPVLFPGFSWHNAHPAAPVNEIPRLQGKFLWKQFVEAQRIGAPAAYVAMFDEMDEGTAIFKCTSDVPVGASPFVTFEGLPSDHYLWLTGMGGKLLRGQMVSTPDPPSRTQTDVKPAK